MIATSATRPIVRPTAAPVLRPLFLLFVVIAAALPAFGGLVGVTVTVCTTPVSVSRETVGVGVHVEELLDFSEEVVMGADVVCAAADVVDVVDVELVDAAAELAPSVPDGATSSKAMYA